MQIRLRSEQIAGLLCFVAAVLAGVGWYVYMFLAAAPGRPPGDSLYARLASPFALEGADRWWPIWAAALPLALTVIGAAYLSRQAHSQTTAVLLLAVLAFLAGSSFLLTTWLLAIFVALPIFWGWRCVFGT